MGCDIHLRLERRRKEPKVYNKFYTQGTEWRPCYIFGYDKTWTDRIYGMFAALADVRNYHEVEHLPLRGFPGDACDDTKCAYTYYVMKDAEYKDQDWAVSQSDAEKWVEDGSSEWMVVGGVKRVIGPDWHSPNWCTTQEMEDCMNKIFHGDKEWQGDYEEWIALLGAMKGYESTGEFECRAVFWFDN